MAYAWITQLEAVQALAARLADPGMVFWVKPELELYLAESLRTFGAITEIWNQDYPFSPSAGTVWYNVSTLPNSPRVRTITDAYIYTVLQYHLLEPTKIVGAQFSISDYATALERRRDEMIQLSGCNVVQLAALPSTPNVRRTTFPDSTLEPRRARFVPADGSPPITLTREDSMAWDAFEPSHLQQIGQMPRSWGVISGPPLSMDVDLAPSVAGSYDVLGLVSGPAFNPPAVTLLGVPDDWTWVAKWGALADLLSRDSEATDRQRADYALKRYNDGLQIMKASNWLLSATRNNAPVDTPSVRQQDGFSAEWEDNPAAWPCLVQAGMDLVAACPVAGTLPLALSMVLVGNSPVPTLDGDFVQCSRDTFDAVLDYAQVLATFKSGGAEFASTQDLEKNFFAVAMEQNKRLSKMGIFSDMLHLEGKRQDIAVPR